MLILVIVGLAVIAAVIRAVVDQHHRRELQAWVMVRGWSVRAGGGGDWMECLPQDRRRTGVNVQLAGPEGDRLVTVADYWYQTPGSIGPNTSSKRKQRLTVVVVSLAAEFPPVTLHPRTIGGLGLGIAQAEVLDPDNLTGAAEFDHRFRVEAGPLGGGELVTEQVIQATLQPRLPPWQLRGHELIIAWPGPLRVAGLDHKLSQAVTLAGALDPVS